MKNNEPKTMNRLTLLILPFVPLCLCVSLFSEEPEDLAPTIIEVDEQKNKAALTPEGWVGDRVWHEMSGFNEGLCPVQADNDGKWGAIDMTGNLVVPLEFDVVGQCNGGLLPVKKGIAWGYLKRDGSVALALTDELQGAGAFLGSNLAPAKKDGLWGYINPEGKFSMVPQFEEARSFSKESTLARVKKNGLWGFIDPTGKEVIPFKYAYVVAHNSFGTAWVQENETWGIVNTEGHVILPPSYVGVHEFSKNTPLAAVQEATDGLWGFVNLSGKLVIPHRYKQVTMFTEGYCDVNLNDRWVLINDKGEVQKIQADEAWAPVHGLAKIRQGKTFGLAKVDGTTVEPAKWWDVYQQRGGHTVLRAVSGASRGVYATRNVNGSLSDWHAAPRAPISVGPPILRIDTTMHTNEIVKVATDRSGSVVLTASSDKTAKLWRLERSGNQTKASLIRTLRPSFDTESDSEGMLTACALSPDGKYAAVGGHNEFVHEGGRSIHIFDTGTGQLINSWPVRSETLDIEFSPSGLRVAATLAGVKGLCVFDSVTGEQLAEDYEYEDSSAGINWSGEDQLVTVSAEGKLRLYDMKTISAGIIEPKAVHSTKYGKMPWSAKFSPDGDHIAVGYADSKIVSIHSSKDLTLIKKLETSSGSGSNLAEVEWLTDGSLATAGSWNKVIDNQWCYPVRVWPANGTKLDASSKIQPADTAATAINIVTDLCRTPTGVIFAGAGPEWGIIEVDSKGSYSSTMLGDPPSAQFNGKAFAIDGLRLSPDGMEVGFEYGPNEQQAIFSVQKQKLQPIPDRESFPDTLSRCRRDSARLTQKESKQGVSYFWSGQPFDTLGNGDVLGFSILPDDSKIFLSNNNGFSCFDHKAKHLWGRYTATALCGQ